MKFLKKNKKFRGKKSGILLDLNFVPPLRNSNNPLLEQPISKQEKGVEASEVTSQTVEINRASTSTRRGSDSTNINKYLPCDKVSLERFSGIEEFSKPKCYDKELCPEKGSVEAGRKGSGSKHKSTINRNTRQAGSGKQSSQKDGISSDHNLGKFREKRRSSLKLVTQISKAGYKISTSTKTTISKLFPGIKQTTPSIHQYDTIWNVVSASKERDLDVGGKKNPNFKSSAKPAQEVGIRCNAKKISKGSRFPCEKNDSTFAAKVEPEPIIKTKVKKVRHRHETKIVRLKKERTQCTADEQPKITELAHISSIQERKTSLPDDKTEVKNDNIEDTTLEKTIITLRTLQNCVQHQTHCQSPIYQKLLQLNNQSTDTCRNTSKPKARAWGFKSIELDGTFSVFLC
ncbi:hypothetical protein ZYGR_0AL01860 [Zygosaccharomyces rouxii]|uniref:Uncharacterized protein n=1 Tax=Zygosaccharomyces rouxii TaxID=4956 RepID=A0A1Q3AFD3_ZYGRO|nr:hypothetical protein ZYGR_0AL01860 [Zygosaccharomyces rouxii]